jgi:hypothetical protein
LKILDLNGKKLMHPHVSHNEHTVSKWHPRKVSVSLIQLLVTFTCHRKCRRSNLYL